MTPRAGCVHRHAAGLAYRRPARRRSRGRGDPGARRPPRPHRDARCSELTAIRAAACKRWCLPARCGWRPTARSTPRRILRRWSTTTPPPTPTSSTWPGGRRVPGHGARRREPRAAGGPSRRSGDVPPFAGSAPRSTDPDADAPAAPRWPSRRRIATSTNWSSTRCARRCDRCAVDVHIAAAARAEPNGGGVAPQHTHHRPTARNIDHRIGSRDRAASRPLPWAGCPPRPRRRLISDTRGRSRVLRRGRRLVRPRGDGRWVVSIRCAQLSADRRTAGAMRAAASSPNPIPTTKSPRRQQNSGPS